MTLTEKIERAFARRPIPKEVVRPNDLLRLDSDVEEALWFAGRDWREITWQDWQEHSCAIFFFSPQAFAYYLPSVLILSANNSTKALSVADSLIGQLDRSPSIDGWDESFANKFSDLCHEEFDVLKEWLLRICEFVPYQRWGIATSGPGDTFGRAYDTVALLQKESRNAP